MSKKLQNSQRSKPKTQVQYAPGLRVLQQIKRQKASTNLVLPTAGFSRLVKGVGMQLSQNQDLKWSKLSIQALQHAAEEYLVQIFEDSYLCSLHAKRCTLLVKDIQLARRIRGRMEDFQQKCYFRISQEVCKFKILEVSLMSLLMIFKRNFYQFDLQQKLYWSHIEVFFRADFE